MTEPEIQPTKAASVMTVGAIVVTIALFVVVGILAIVAIVTVVAYAVSRFAPSN